MTTKSMVGYKDDRSETEFKCHVSNMLFFYTCRHVGSVNRYG